MTQRVHPYRIHLYRDRAFRWRYRTIAGNHRVCDDPEQGFTKRHAIKRAIDGLPSEVLPENGGPGYTIETITT